MRKKSLKERKKDKKLNKVSIGNFILGLGLGWIEIQAWSKLSSNEFAAQAIFIGMALYMVVYRPYLFEAAFKADEDGEYFFASIYKFIYFSFFALSVMGMFIYFGDVYHTSNKEAAANSVEAKLARIDLEQARSDLKDFETLNKSKLIDIAQASQSISELELKRKSLLSEQTKKHQEAIIVYNSILNKKANNSAGEFSSKLVSEILSKDGSSIINKDFRGVAKRYQAELQQAWSEMESLNPVNSKNPDVISINKDISSKSYLLTLNTKHQELKKEVNKAQKNAVVSGESVGYGESNNNNKTKYEVFNDFINIFTGMVGIHINELRTSQALLVFVSVLFIVIHSMGGNMVLQLSKADTSRKKKINENTVLDDTVSKVRSWFSRTRNTKTLSGKTVVAQHGKSNAPAKAQFCGNIERISNKPSPEPSRGIGFMANIDQTPAVRIERGRGKYSNERILELKQMGLNNKQIAEEIGASPQTVGRRIKLMQEQNIIG